MVDIIVSLLPPSHNINHQKQKVYRQNITLYLDETFLSSSANLFLPFIIGVLDREGNPRKVVNCSCVVVRDWGEESQERSILLNYFQTEQ